MDLSFAHLAEWQFPNGEIGHAVYGRYEQRFRDLLLEAPNRYGVPQGLCEWIPGLGLYLFKPSYPPQLIRHLIIRAHGEVRSCALCFSGSPCWVWPTFQTSEGHLLSNKLSEVDNPSKVIMYQRAAAAVGATAVGLLQNQVPEFRQALESTSQATRSRERSVEVVPLVPQAQRQPTGGVRCVTCGQVIPPGTPPLQPQKTQDEIYETCKHEFDEQGICKICKLPKRQDRFSLLEVD